VLQELGISDVDLLPTPELLEADLRRGRPVASSAALVDDYCQRAAEKSLPWPLARAARCRGLVADDASFEDHFLEALRQHGLTSDSFERGRSHLCFGERLRRVRRRTQALRELRQAFAIFDRLVLADGATTRETAARLFLSPKTVEYHLRNVYDKLGVRTRVELAQALAAGVAAP
jgi:DNA-binding transcriptional ArsR family regulator